ncbi:MAG: hypothetical protein OEY97_01175 [Nitrospirota bacterium]|nr:hypothetical protein [Nitrospirota bacterium]
MISARLNPWLIRAVCGASLLVALTACGGVTATREVSGVVSKGPVDGATVRVYALTSQGRQGDPLAGPVVTERGGFRITISDGGPLLVCAEGGRYMDEATAIEVQIGAGPCVAFCLKGPRRWR